MSKIVVISCELEEAEAVKICLERIRLSTDDPSQLVKFAVSFNAKLHKAIQRAKVDNVSQR